MPNLITRTRCNVASPPNGILKTHATSASLPGLAWGPAWMGPRVIVYGVPEFVRQTYVGRALVASLVIRAARLAVGIILRSRSSAYAIVVIGPVVGFVTISTCCFLDHMLIGRLL